MRTIQRTLCSLLGAAVLVAGCNYKNPEQEERERDRDAIILALLTPTPFQASCPSNATSTTFSAVSARASVTGCTTCHSGSTLNGGFDVTSVTAAQARVVANDPQNSSLYRKIVVGSMASNSDATMNQTVLNWICSGAPP